MKSALIQESAIDTFNTIMQTVNKVTNRDSNGKNKSGYYLGGSIAKYTKNLIMSFPVLCDDSLSLESSQIISKANEKNIASMLEMLFASMSLQGKEGTTGKDVLGFIHKNIDSMGIDDYIDAANDFIANHENAYIPKVTDIMIREANREFIEQLKTPQKSFPVSSFNERSLNDYMCKDTYNGTIVYEHISAVNEANPPSQLDYDKYDLERDKFNYQRQNDYQKNIYQSQRDKERDEFDREKFNYQSQRDKERDEYQANRDNIKDTQYNKDFEYRRQQDQFKSNLDINRNRILDSDFKKANELQPTTMVVNFNVVEVGANGEPAVVDRKSFVAGVKCRMIATSSIDIAERLIAKNRSKINFKNLIRANTGEISLVKDFLLALDQQKLDAKNDAKRGEAARVWNTIKKRSVKNNIRKCMRDKNDASAITTLIVSQDTVNYMISTAKFDVSKPSNAKLIMDSYNLLCLVIADDTNEVAKFLYDGNSDFDAVSYNALSREYQDKNYKKEVNVLNKQWK